MPASMDAACIAAWSLAQGFRGKRCIRLLRDVLSSPLMINNERILANIATSNLMSGVPTSLRD